MQRYRRTLVLLTALVTLALAAGPAGGATIWREGESADVKSVTRHPWWYDKVKAEQLSEGEWISNWGNEPGTVAYDLPVPEAGDYALWLRANPASAKLSYRVDAGDWRPVPLEEAEDRINVAADEAVDLRFVGWVKAGRLRLEEGRHTLRFKMHSENNNHGAIDAFVLSTEPFTPHGTAKPAEVAAAGEEAAPQPLLHEGNSWAFTPPEDQFTDDALLDLRRLNEQEAGRTGFIRLSEDGMGFVRGDGEPIRFWSAVSGLAQMDPEQMERHCKFLSKRGVNMIRIHGNLAASEEGDRITDVNADAVEGIKRAVAVAKRHGIYVTISPYWYHHKMPKSWGLEGYQGGEMPTGTMFFNEKFQDGYKRWVRELYATPNPHTGVPLKDEPAVAIIQVKNEDSLLFYTFDRIPPEQKRKLGGMYADWLREKYGSLQAAHRAWDGHTIGQPQNPNMIADDWDGGPIGFLITWQYTQQLGGGMKQRANDQLRFLAEVQRDFYAEIDRYYREELGCKQLTNAMNWKSADKLTTDDAERWTYTACDVIAVNRYTGGIHRGENNGYRIDPGHYLKNVSVLRNPLRMPTNLKQVVGHPFIITESAWVHPNLYQTEGPLMAAAYMSVNGVDSLYWFAMNQPTWLLDPRRKFWRVKPGPTGFAIDKWSGNVPQQAGMLPANALLYRLGYLKPGRTVVHAERSMDEIWRREHPIIAETETFDPNRDVRDLRGETGAEVGQVSRLAFLTGKVETVFGGDPAETRVVDLSPYIDSDARRVRSTTGEVELDYGVGLLRVSAPGAAGVAGFLKQAGGEFALGDVTVLSDNDYAAVTVVAMDERPLAESGEVLVQVGTVARLTGWTTKEDSFEQGDQTVRGKRILYTGKPPWRIKNTQVTVSIANPDLSRATLLDEAGYPDREVETRREGGRLTVELPEDTMYLVLR
ncbi:MAG: hypothetical protein ACOC7T_05270 [Planctomycetota bacterium]